MNFSKFLSGRQLSWVRGVKNINIFDGLKPYFFYLLIISFFFIASFAISFKRQEINGNLPAVVLGTSKKAVKLPPVPVLEKNVKGYPVISANAALAIDLGSHVSLYEKDPDKKLLPASTTKIMTALVALNYYQENDIVEINGLKTAGQRLGLSGGEKYRAQDLISALLIYSANDAVEALAHSYFGGQEAFVERMNQKAKELRLVNTHFENAIGFDGLGHYSTARDLVKVSEVAMRNDFFRETVATKEKTISEISGKQSFLLSSTNELLGSVDGVMGVKTGWTENARENLVTYIERGGKEVLIAVLGSSDRFGETKELIDWIFSNYNWKEVKLID